MVSNLFVFLFLALSLILSFVFHLFFNFYLVGIVTVYGFFLLVRFVVLNCSGDWNAVKMNLLLSQSDLAKHKKQNVVAIVPAYNEDLIILKNTLEALLRSKLSIVNLKICWVDDGSTQNHEETEELKKWAEENSIHVMTLPENKGKREAQRVAFDYYESVDFFVTVDSDTQVEKNSVETLVRVLLSKKDLGAATGLVGVINRKKNILTRLIDARYWLAFNNERAFHSNFLSVLCCSGPLTVYRASLIQKIKHAYNSQEFLGEKCTYGDDRHLSNLILQNSFKTVFVPFAKAKTHVPEKYLDYFRQQVRWNKSFYRELYWMIKNRVKINFWLYFDQAFQFFFPYLIFSLTIILMYQYFSEGIFYPALLVISFGILFMYSIIGYYRSSNRNLLIFPVYFLIFILFLIPARVYALVTMHKTGWITR